MGAWLLASCGGGSTQPPQLVSLFSPSRVIVAGRPQRLPFGLVDNRPDDAEDLADDVPLIVRVLHEGELIDEQRVVGRVVSHDHAPGSEEHQHANLLRYYPLRTTLPTPSIYDLEVEVFGGRATLPVQAFDPAEVALPLVGDLFPSIDTPTVDDWLDVDPLCTLNDGPCPFHKRNAAEVLEAGEAMALLVATPAFCATSYCGPVLQTLIDVAATVPEVAMVHVEPWANPREGEGLADPDLRVTSAVQDIGLEFEPALFLVNPAGQIIERIDNVFDQSELIEALDQLR